MQKKYGPSNITVNAIAPGHIETDMDSYLTKEEREKLKKEILLGRAGTPEDVANIAYMLCKNKYITGQTITVDGGWME